jgi:hypothetical protein
LPILLLGVAHRLADWWQVAGFPGVMVVEDRWLSMGSGFRWAVVFDKRGAGTGTGPGDAFPPGLVIAAGRVGVGSGTRVAGWLAGWRGVAWGWAAVPVNRDAGQPGCGPTGKRANLSERVEHPSPEV